MQRNQVIQFRVEECEKEELEQRAHPGTVSDLIRGALGLRVGKTERAAKAKPEDNAWLHSLIKKDRGAATGEDEVEALARQLHNAEGLTMMVARREARKRLGL